MRAWSPGDGACRALLWALDGLAGGEPRTDAFAAMLLWCHVWAVLPCAFWRPYVPCAPPCVQAVWEIFFDKRRADRLRGEFSFVCSDTAACVPSCAVVLCASRSAVQGRAGRENGIKQIAAKQTEKGVPCVAHVHLPRVLLGTADGISTQAAGCRCTRAARAESTCGTARKAERCIARQHGAARRPRSARDHGAERVDVCRDRGCIRGERDGGVHPLGACRALGDRDVQPGELPPKTLGLVKHEGAEHRRVLLAGDAVRRVSGRECEAGDTPCSARERLDAEHTRRLPLQLLQRRAARTRDVRVRDACRGQDGGAAACERGCVEEEPLPAEAARARLHHRALERRRVVHARRAEADGVAHGVEQPESLLRGTELDGHEERREAARRVCQRGDGGIDEGEPLVGAQRQRGDRACVEEEARRARPHRAESRAAQDARGETGGGKVLGGRVDAAPHDQVTQLPVQAAHLCVCERGRVG